MSEMKSRRELGLMITGGVIAAGLVAGAKTAAAEPQPNMVRARESLVAAMAFLRDSASDKGGHRGKAMGLIQDAIEEVDEGIHYANTH